jgi:hypothetical protein
VSQTVVVVRRPSATPPQSSVGQGQASFFHNLLAVPTVQTLSLSSDEISSSADLSGEDHPSDKDESSGERELSDDRDPSDERKPSDEFDS